MNNKIKRYLISTTAHLGDFIWATSAIAILKQTFPNIKITVLAPKSISELIISNPVIDDVIYISYSSNDFKSKIKRLFLSITLIIKIFFKNFDTAIILDSSRMSVLISKLAMIPNIVGGDLYPFGYNFENPISKYYTHVVKLHKNQDFIHASMRFQTIIKSYMNTSNNAMPVLPDSSKYRQKALELIRNNNKIAILLCIKGSENTSHIYNIKNFKNIIDILNKKFSNLDFYIVGTKQDFNYAQQLTTIKNVYNICGKTSLLQLRELCKLSKLLISLDTGTIHLAATTNINIISLHGASSYKNTGPMSYMSYPIYHNTNCSPCFYKRFVKNIGCQTYPNPKCLAGIAPKEIADKAIKILENNLNE